MIKPIDSLLRRDDLWLASQWQQPQQGIPTGMGALDSQLSQQGWPKQGIIEVLQPEAGQGETLVLKALLQTSSEQWQLMISPPYIPYAPALAQQGVDLSRLVWLKDLDSKERLWAAEQSLASGSFARVWLWLDSLSVSQSRRLQLASERGHSLAVVFLPESQAGEHHPISLRVQLHSSSSGTTVQLLKQRGGWPQATQRLPLQPSGWPLTQVDTTTNDNLISGPWTHSG